MSLLTLKTNWSNSLLEEDLQSTINCYSEDFIFKGTFSNSITSDIKCLKKYFKHFSKKVKKVVFLKNNKIIKNKDTIIDTGKYNFHTKEGSIIKASYQFVINKKDFKIISHFSLLLK